MLGHGWGLNEKTAFAVMFLALGDPQLSKVHPESFEEYVLSPRSVFRRTHQILHKNSQR
jgi:hypothetical protein